jgi:hypothetical protein
MMFKKYEWNLHPQISLLQLHSNLNIPKPKKKKNYYKSLRTLLSISGAQPSSVARVFQTET